MTVTDTGAEQIPTAVVADRMPLIRLGLVASLRLAGVTTVGHADSIVEGVDAARALDATVLVLGGTGEPGAEALGRHLARLGPTSVIVLVAQADRPSLLALLEAGAHAVALRTIAPEEFSVLVRRVLAGERSVGPALMSVLLDLVREEALASGPSGVEPSRQASVAVGGMATRVVEAAPSMVMTEARATAGQEAGLTTKELQVLARLAHGETNAEIARALFVSTATVKTHLTHIYTKLGVGSRHAAMSRAVALGVLL